MRELEVLDGGRLKLCWEERKGFFEEMLDEQVRGEVKRLLEEALALVWPGVLPQRCWAHKLRNIADKVPKKQGWCVREAAAIYQAAGRRQALRAYRRWAEKWRPWRPRAVASLERDLDELLNFFTVPKAHWRKVRTTNVIERCFREVRRRTRPVSSFSNPASCDRIIFGVLSHLNPSWEETPLKQFTQKT